MTRKIKLHAFTLTEVMVTMAISSLVIIMSYSVYRMLNIYFSRVESENVLNAERLGFRQVFSGDIREADSVLFREDALFLFYRGKEVSWHQKGDSTLIRKDSEEKHFRIGPCKIEIGVHTSLPYADDIRIVFSPAEEEPFYFRFHKNYLISKFVN